LVTLVGLFSSVSSHMTHQVTGFLGTKLALMPSYPSNLPIIVEYKLSEYLSMLSRKYFMTYNEGYKTER